MPEVLREERSARELWVPLMFGREKRQDREILQVMGELKDRGWDADAMAVLPADVRKRIHEAQQRAKPKKDR